MNNTNDLKFQIGKSLIAFLGLLPSINAQESLTVGGNKFAEQEAVALREKAKIKSEGVMLLIESFIAECVKDERILLEWIAKNEELIKQQDSLIATTMLNELKNQKIL